jgi:uncharacterized protein (DUF433 family)
MSSRRNLPPVRIPHPHVEIDPYTGSPRIVGTAHPVRRLFSWHRQGATVDSLVRRHPAVGIAKILDALAFAYDNLDVITADLCFEREAIAAEEAKAAVTREPATGVNTVVVTLR